MSGFQVWEGKRGSSGSLCPLLGLNCPAGCPSPTQKHHLPTIQWGHLLPRVPLQHDASMTAQSLLVLASPLTQFVACRQQSTLQQLLQGQHMGCQHYPGIGSGCKSRSKYVRFDFTSVKTDDCKLQLYARRYMSEIICEGLGQGIISICSGRLWSTSQAADDIIQQ